MLVNTKSISGIVKDIVGCNISFQDSLQRNYCNISALARILKPEMDKLLDKNVSLESIITALKRLRKIYKKNHSGTPIFSILAGSMISVKTDVTKLSASKSKNTIEKIGKALRRNVDNFINVYESNLSITLIFDYTLLEGIKSMFSHRDILEIEDGLAAIIVRSPEEIIKTPGCAVAFYNQLSTRDINIEDTVSCYTDTIILVKMSEVGKAFNVLTNLICNARSYPRKRDRGDSHI